MTPRTAFLGPVLAVALAAAPGPASAGDVAVVPPSSWACRWRRSGSGSEAVTSTVASPSAPAWITRPAASFTANSALPGPRFRSLRTTFSPGGNTTLPEALPPGPRTTPLWEIVQPDAHAARSVPARSVAATANVLIPSPP